MTRTGRALALAACVAPLLWGCDREEPAGPDRGEGIAVERASVRLAQGETVALRVTDGGGRDVTDEVTWRSGDGDVVAVRSGGRLRGVAPGITRVTAEHPLGSADVRVNVPFAAAPDSGMALRIDVSEDSPLALSGIAYLYDRLADDFDHTSVLATPGALRPEMLEIGDFGDADTVVHLSFPGSASEGAHVLESWEVEQREDGGFRFVGGPGVAIWIADPDDPYYASLYVSVGEIEIEFDEAARPEIGSDRTLTGRMAFDAAGLLVDRAPFGPPTIEGPLGDEAVRVYAEFRLDHRLWPVGHGSMEVEDGPRPLPVVEVGAPLAGPHGEGLLWDYTVFVDGTVWSTQMWIGSPAEGTLTLDAVDLAALRGRDAYARDLTWAWTAVDEGDVQSPLHGTSEVMAFSHGGTLTVTRWVPPGPESFGLLEGTLEATQTVATGSGGTQTVRADFVAPVLPPSLAPHFLRPPVLPPFEPPGEDPSVVQLGTGHGTLQGTVRLNEIDPVAGARVTLEGQGVSGTAVTNEHGGFLFVGAPLGQYTLSVEADGGLQAAEGQELPLGPFEVTPLRQVEDVLLADAPGNGLVVGHAATEDSHVDGVRFVVTDAAGAVVATLVTGDDGPGRARALLPPGRYTASVEPPAGYSVLSASWPRDPVVEVRKGRVSGLHVALVPD